MGRYPARGLFRKLTQEDHDLVDDALKTMSIYHLKDYPLRALSGGQQQRVYLAQVLARHADLLILDEPTSGLDAAGKEIYQRAMLQEMAHGASLVTATHDIQEAAECHQVMLLARRVIAIGSAAQVLTPEALLQAFGVTILQKDECLRLAVLEREHDHCGEQGTRR
jgi:ABC-type Mn2+/Zn2+ transport system ATPase subunit